MMKFFKSTLNFKNIFPLLLGSYLLGTVNLAYADDTKKVVPDNDTDPVLIFNRLCYAQVPVVANIEKISDQMAWKPMGGDDLKQFTTQDDPQYLKGWDVLIAQKLYRLGVVQSRLNDSFMKNFPQFLNGTATACSLVLDGKDEWKTIVERMNTLVGKEPLSSDVSDGQLLTTTWAGGNEDFKVFVFGKATQEGNATLLNVTILTKE